MNVPKQKMDYEEILVKFPDIVKIKPHHIAKVMNEKGIGDFDPNKTWVEMGFEELDNIELIIELETMLNIIIPDEMAEIIFDMNSTPYIFVAAHREHQLSRLFDNRKNS